VPLPNGASLLWGAAGAIAQIIATALLLRAMAERNFALGVAWSKTEIVQVAIFGTVLLGDPLTLGVAASVLLATVGVMLFSSKGGGAKALIAGWTSRAALIGLASGAFFAISAVGYRGAALALAPSPPLVAAAVVLVYAQALQSVVLGGWLLWRDPSVILRVLRAWRTSLLAGFMGAAASAGWFTAMAMVPVANVRTVGLVELLFSYVVSHRVFQERLTTAERAGLALVTLGMVGILNVR
jgi:drug/metabolite transporter (DMT)-like permease